MTKGIALVGGLSLAVLLLLVACNGGPEEAEPTPTPTPTPAPVVARPSPTPEATPTASATSTPVTSTIVFLGGSSRTPPPGVYLVQVDGTAPRRIGDHIYFGRRDFARLEWSPDGTKVAFWLCPDEPPLRDSEVYVMNADGTGLTNVSNHPKLDVVLCQSDAPPGGMAWSPDSERLVFYSGRDPGGLYVVNADGTDLRFLTDGALPAWSPSGDSIVFAASQFSTYEAEWEVPIYSINPDGRNRRLLTAVPCSFSVLHGCFVPWPQWSPDGTMLAFTATLEQPEGFEDSDYDVFIMNADGTDLTLLKDLPKNDPPGGGSYFANWVNCELPVPTAGCEVNVTNVDPDRLRVRQNPGTDQEIIARLSEGDAVCLLGSPALADGFQWWPVRSESGIEGWVAQGDPEEPEQPWLTPTGRECEE